MGITYFLLSLFTSLIKTQGHKRNVQHGHENLVDINIPLGAIIQ